MDIDEPVNIENKSRNDPLYRVITSDRMTRDVEILMNSSYWVEALKKKNAVGISEDLNFQLIESQQFIKDFIRYAVSYKRGILNYKINTQNTSFSTDVNNNQVFASDHKQERYVSMPVQFLVECIFLSVLDADDYIATSSDIITKTIEWFPQMLATTCQIKSLIENILNTTACFKRLMNFTKSTQQNRPIILGKRQYIWSINQEFIKPFVRYFSKLKDAKNISEQATTKKIDDTIQNFSIPLSSSAKISQKLDLKNLGFRNQNKPRNADSQSASENLVSMPSEPSSQKTASDYTFSTLDQTNLFNSWKSKIDQFKLLIQIKHNNYGFTWCDSIILQQNVENLEKLDFIRFGKPIRLKSMRNQYKLNSKQVNLNAPNQMTTKSRIVKKKQHNGAPSAKAPPAARNLKINTDLTTRIHPEASKLNKPDVHNMKSLQNKPVDSVFDEKDTSTNLENLMTNEELLRLEQSKQINSMISENFTYAITSHNTQANNSHTVMPSTTTISSHCINNTVQTCSYFNLMPVSPSSLCQNYATTSFFNPNEINVASMLVSSVETGVEELFCDDL